MRQVDQTVAAEAKHHVGDFKVLFISGYAEGLVGHQSPLAADADLLIKPFRKHEFAQKIRAALDR